MSKALLHFRTVLGPRTIVAEIGDAATAQAIINAHLASGEQAALVDEMPRQSLKDFMAKHERDKAKARAKAAKLSLVPRADNVRPFKRARP